LIQYLSPEGKKLDTRTCDVGSAHLAFNISNLRELYGELISKGVKFTSEPMLIPVGLNRGALCVYLKDPDGITLEFIQAREP